MSETLKYEDATTEKSFISRKVTKIIITITTERLY